MAEPRSELEQEWAGRTLNLAGPAENLVSSNCPQCDVRFVMLAVYHEAGWQLRCTNCGWCGDGELKPSR